jgi:hypothetical protein
VRLKGNSGNVGLQGISARGLSSTFSDKCPNPNRCFGHQKTGSGSPKTIQEDLVAESNQRRLVNETFRRKLCRLSFCQCTQDCTPFTSQRIWRIKFSTCFFHQMLPLEILHKGIYRVMRDSEYICHISDAHRPRVQDDRKHCANTIGFNRKVILSDGSKRKLSIPEPAVESIGVQVRVYDRGLNVTVSKVMLN